jgi:serine/threonine-protein kinase
MAFVEGQSLRDFVRLRKKIQPLEASEIMVGIMSGLTYAFNKGITHRDLKLSNVLMSSDGAPHLVDFGLAGGAEAEHGIPNARSVDYAGLEKLTGVPKDDPRSDIYFAGCMYYHMLSGEPPLTESKDRLQRMNISRFREVVPIRDLEPMLPSVVEQVVEKCMTLKAGERYSRPVDVQVDLQKAVNALKAAAEQGDPSGSSLSLASRRVSAVCLVESNPAVQDAVRAALKKEGYHVMVLEDPERTWQLILASPDQVGCLVVSTASLGREALNLYRNVRAYPRTKKIPTVLLLGKSHAELQQKLGLPLDRHRAMVMPLRASELVGQVRELFEPEENGAIAAQEAE